MHQTNPPNTPCTHPKDHTHELRSDELIQTAAKMCAAMGDPGRLRLLELLFDGEHCVSQLVQETGDAMPTISHRLKQL